MTTSIYISYVLYLGIAVVILYMNVSICLCVYTCVFIIIDCSYAWNVKVHYCSGCIGLLSRMLWRPRVINQRDGNPNNPNIERYIYKISSYTYYIINYLVSFLNTLLSCCPPALASPARRRRPKRARSRRLPTGCAAVSPGAGRLTLSVPRASLFFFCPHVFWPWQSAEDETAVRQKLLRIKNTYSYRYKRKTRSHGH